MLLPKKFFGARFTKEYTFWFLGELLMKKKINASSFVVVGIGPQQIEKKSGDRL